MSVTEEIKSRLDIVDIISESVSLRRSGRNFAGFCPFHQNTRTPAFYVFPETQTWRCFGACAEGGDLFSYVMKKEGWEFKEALRVLADRAGVRLETHRQVDPQKKAQEEKLADLISAAADYFHQLFLHAPQAEAARAYIERRGLREETIAEFKIGFALNSWDACRTHFNAQGYDDAALLGAGLLTENPDNGRRYDRFRHRLMIPIMNDRGRVVGFGARTLEKDGIPKYLNSPQTALFDKSHLLFGLHLAKRDIREARQAVIVEGYMDVMQAWQAGFRNVIAQMGTALTEQQLGRLKKLTKEFVIALDADAAGAQATLRSLQVARETLDRDVEIKFDARGLVQHEGRLDAAIRIATMPPGKDPDNVIQEDPGQWAMLVAAAKPVVQYVIDITTADLDPGDAKGKTTVARQIIPLIQDLKEPIERDHYWQQLAHVLGVDERALRQMKVVGKKGPRSRPQPPPPPPSLMEEEGGDGRLLLPNKTIAMRQRQFNYLRYCLQQPQLIRRVDQKLTGCDLQRVGQDDFSLPEDRALLQQLWPQLNRQSVAAAGDLWDSLDTTLQERVQQLLAKKISPGLEVERLADKLAVSVLDWRLETVRQTLAELKRFSEDARAAQDEEAAQVFQQQLLQLPLIMRQLHKARSAMSATNRRRAQQKE
jgi:DNA primase